MLTSLRARAVLLVLLFAFAFAFSAAYEIAAADINCKCQCMYICPYDGQPHFGTPSPACRSEICVMDIDCYNCKINY